LYVGNSDYYFMIIIIITLFRETGCYIICYD